MRWGIGWAHAHFLLVTCRLLHVTITLMTEEQAENEGTHITGALVAGIVVFEGLYWYFYAALGKLPDLFFLNKILAWTAVVLLMLTLLIGPLCALIPGLRKTLHTRKYLGLLMAVVALLHVVITLFFLKGRFGLAYWTEASLGLAFGLGAILLYLYLALISNRFMLQQYGPQLWWSVQHWGVRAAFVLTYLHVFFAKFDFWLGWWQTGKPSPNAPISLLLFVVMSGVLLLRVAFYFLHKIQQPAPAPNPAPATLPQNQKH